MPKSYISLQTAFFYFFFHFKRFIKPTIKNISKNSDKINYKAANIKKY